MIIYLYSKIEGSQATAKYTVELLRSVISHQRVPHANQAAALIAAVKAVGEQLVAANPVGMHSEIPFFFLLHLLIQSVQGITYCRI